MYYPFLFQISGKNEPKWVVKIALFDYVTYDASWMDDPDVGDTPLVPDLVPLVPDVDLTKSNHFFNTEEEALAFIKEWWTNS